VTIAANQMSPAPSDDEPRRNDMNTDFKKRYLRGRGARAAGVRPPDSDRAAGRHPDILLDEGEERFRAETFEEDRVQAVAFAGDEFYIAGSADQEKLNYVMNRDGELQRTFHQLSPSRYGFSGLAVTLAALLGGLEAAFQESGKDPLPAALSSIFR